MPLAAQVTRRELKNLRTYKGSVNRLLERVSKLKQVMAPAGTCMVLCRLSQVVRGHHPALLVAATSINLTCITKPHRALTDDVEDGLQEIESILDNPNEMADMYLASKEAALEAEAEQVSLSCPI